ncbi:hypothetical protein PWT90_06123 [Aphanocladium album]|nr:hypothetical protein PWT90_06123 [Aphanocladium album]
MRWIFAGIYAPELVVFVAWRQWCSARMLQKQIDQLPDHSSKTDSNRDITRSGSHKPGWTMVHSFFACAGGFSVELDSLSGAIPPAVTPNAGAVDEAARPTRLTLTARGVLFLAQNGLLPTVYREEIDDKSKANDLAKATVIVQATWMLVQVIGRLAARLPVTLLEVNTVAHVICAFGMYIFWWNKPLLPSEPFVLRDESMAPLVAFMYSSSEISGQVSETVIKSQTPVKTLLAKMLQYSTTPELESLCLRMDDIDQRRDSSAPTLDMPIFQSPLMISIQKEFVKSGGMSESEMKAMVPECTLLSSAREYRFQPAPQSCLQLLHDLKAKEEGTAFFERRPRVIYNSEMKPRDDPDIRRWDLMNEALQSDPCLLSDRVLLSHQIYCESFSGKFISCIHLKPEQLVARHISNWPSNDLLRNVDGLIVGIILWLANLFYGAFHAAAWNEHFPSSTEKWLWRAAAAYIAFCGGFWVILNSAVSKWARLNNFWEKWMDGEKSWAETILLGALVVLCGSGFILARMYLVVEAFLSIRQLPVEAYQTPQWTDVFPHL